jgi:hypothetical protein
MTELIDFKRGERPHDPEFRKILNAALKEVGLSKEERIGMLFLLGYSISRQAMDNLSQLSNAEKKDRKNIDKAKEMVALYASSKKEFWGKLDPDALHTEIYNLCYICHHVLADNEEELDGNLRSVKLGISGNEVMPLKADLDKEWIARYASHSLNLSTASNAYYDFVRRVGSRLCAENVSMPDSYCIGLATYGYMQHFDVKGNDYIAGFLSKFYSPLFSAMARHAELYLEFPYELSRNHIFSTIFYCHNGGIEEIVRAGIHKAHQMVFYDESTCELRKFWNFKDPTNYQELITSTFRCAAHIRNKYINYEDVHIRAVIQSGEVFDSDAIGADLSEEELWNLVCEVMSQKYGYYVSAHGWQCAGEFMEFIGVFFYETSLHAIVSSSIATEG